MKTKFAMFAVWLMCLFVAVSTTLAAGGGGGGSGGPVMSTSGNVNPLDVARAFALKTPNTYHGAMGCSMLISNQFVWTWMEWDMDKQFAITSLSVNDIQIALPEPIYGLPMGDAGLARNVSLNLSSMTKEGEYAGFGSLWTNVLSKGDSLVVTLTPASITQVLPVDVTGYDSVQLTIEGLTYGYGWWVDDGMLYVSLPPVGGSYSYVVRSYDGNVIGSGTIEPFRQAVVPNDAYVGAALLGNVKGMAFTQPDGLDDWAYLPGVKMDCSIPVDDGSVSTGKVLFVDVGTGGLEVILDGTYTVYVQSATTEGDMPYLALEDHSYVDPWWHYQQTRVNTTAMGVGKVVITIIPKASNNVANPWFNIHRFYGTPYNGGGGLGKM